jgi:hypothetical protein
MYDPDNFPGADSVPWQLLIRARYAHEVDALVASVVVRQVARFASVKVTEQVTSSAGEGLALSPRDELGAEQRVGALGAVADFDELCPRNWPFHWPPRPHRDFDDLSDPVSAVVVAAAVGLVRTAGSEALNKTLGETLTQVGGFGG